MPIQPNQPQATGAVLDTAFQLYKASLPSVLPICGLSALCDVPSAIYTMRMAVSLQNVTDVQQVSTAALMTLTDPTYYAVAFFAFLVKLWLFAGLTLQMSAIGRDEQLPFKTALGQGVRPMPSMFVAWILYAIISTLGFLLLLVPGIIFSVSLVLAISVIVPLEGKGPISALKMSHQLVWGCWWRTTGILTVGFIIVFVAFAALGLILGVIAPFMGVSAMMQTASSSIVNIVVTLLLSPMYVALLLALYWDLKLRKQGTDLEARVGALGARA